MATVLTGACGLAAAGRLGRGGRSLAATFVLGESAPLEGAPLAGDPARLAEGAIPRRRRDVAVGVLCPGRAWEASDDRARGVQ